MTGVGRGQGQETPGFLSSAGSTIITDQGANTPDWITCSADFYLFKVHKLLFSEIFYSILSSLGENLAESSKYDDIYHKTML